VPAAEEESRYPFTVDDQQAGAVNLAEFVRATAGRKGTHADVRGGVAVASTFAVANGYVNAAVLTDPSVEAVHFFDDACDFFAPLHRPFVMWLPTSATRFLDEAARRELVRDKDPSPGMVAHAPVGFGLTSIEPELGPGHEREPGQRTANPAMSFRAVDDEASAAIFGDLSERAYVAPGMGFLYAKQQSYEAPGSTWLIGYENDVAVTGACGFLHGTTAGIYSVATPQEFRGRGFAAVVTAETTNQLFSLGAQSVCLQASQLGFRVYERLGFTVFDHYERFTITP
jgi:ribosomal protein S18 acetylase RimI-like enzyme